MLRKIMWIQIKKDDSLNISDFRVYSKKGRKMLLMKFNLVYLIKTSIN